MPRRASLLCVSICTNCDKIAIFLENCLIIISKKSCKPWVSLEKCPYNIEQFICFCKYKVRKTQVHHMSRILCAAELSLWEIVNPYVPEQRPRIYRPSVLIPCQPNFFFVAEKIEAFFRFMKIRKVVALLHSPYTPKRQQSIDIFSSLLTLGERFVSSVTSSARS